MGVIRVGTRGSALALAQSGQLAEALRAASGREVELTVVRTEGDRATGSLTGLGGTGVFVTAIREALLDGRCDVAVHSLKDLPTTPHPGVELVAVPPREDPADAVCARAGRTLATLPPGARIGTGSPRRAAQLRAVRPDLEVVDLRGNVDTRLARVRDGHLDAVVLARAGLARLGRLDSVSELLGPDTMLPAPGQGALAVELRADEEDDALTRAVRDLDDGAARAEVVAERTVLATLEAGCSAPVGARAEDGGGRLSLRAVVCSIDGRTVLRSSASTEVTDGARIDAAEALGRRVADDLLRQGAAALAGSTHHHDGRTA